MIKVQNGRYDAQLLTATKYKTSSGKDAVEFLWKLTVPGGSPVSAKTSLCMTRADGSRNEAGIHMTRAWASDWDEQNLDWFVDKLDFCKFYRVSVTVENGEAKYVNPRDYWSTRPKQQAPAPQPAEKPFFDRQLVAELPQEIPQTMLDAWCAFSSACNGKTRAEIEKKWLSMVNKAAPGKLQIKFSADDWKKVIDQIFE